MAPVLRVVALDSTWFWSAGDLVLSLSLRGLRPGQRPVLRRRVAPLPFGREMELVPLPDGRSLLGASTRRGPCAWPPTSGPPSRWPPARCGP